MIKKFYPDVYIASAYDIPYEKMYEEGYRGIIFDVDNTLVPHGAPADERCKNLFKRLRKIGFETCIISNNNGKRVAPLGRAVKSRYISHALKPFKKNYLKGMDLIKC